MAGGSLGSLTIDLAANVTRFERSLNRAERLADNRAKGIQRNIRRLATGVGTALASFGFLRAVEQSFAFADGIAKAADRAGITAERLQELRFAADQYGITQTQLDDGVRRFTRRLGEFINTGAGPAAQAFEDYGIAVRTTDGDLRSTQSVMDDVIQLLGNMESQAEKSALAAKLFGDDAGPQLALLLGQGINEIDRLSSRARDLGIVLSNDLIRGAEKANDELSVLSQVLRVQMTTAVVNLAPAITELSQAITDLATGDLEDLPQSLQFIAFFGNAIAVGFDAAGKAIGAVAAAAVKLFEFDWQGVSSIIEDFNNDMLESEQRLSNVADAIVGIEDRGQGPAASANGGGSDDEGGYKGKRNFLTGMTEEEMDAQIEQILWYHDIWTDYEKEQAKERLEAERVVNSVREQNQRSFVNNSIALLRVFGRKSKSAALAALAIEKGLAIATAVAGTQAAMAKSRIIDPYGVLASKIAVEGALNVATIAALGFAQASQINSSFSGSTPSGAINDPYAVDTDPLGTPGSAPTGTQGTITINVNGVVTDEIVNDLIVPAIQDSVNERDVILFRNDSRQALELT